MNKPLLCASHAVKGSWNKDKSGLFVEMVRSATSCVGYIGHANVSILLFATCDVCCQPIFQIHNRSALKGCRSRVLEF